MNEVAETKARIKSRLAHGDLTKAARVAGVSKATFGEWIAKGRPSSRDVEYLAIIEKVVCDREKAFDEAATRVEAALG